jgi:hypothetical protein
MEDSMQLGELCQGLEYLGTVKLPKGDYITSEVNQHLTDETFATLCLTDGGQGAWAYLGPGNYGPDAWLVLRLLAGGKVVIYIQSKVRSKKRGRFSEAKLQPEARKFWSLRGKAQGCLLYLTDEVGAPADLEALYHDDDLRVVPVSRVAYAAHRGSSVALLKRALEASKAKDRGV